MLPARRSPWLAAAIRPARPPSISPPPRRRSTCWCAAPGLAETMSRYLVDRIAAAPNIELHTRTELAALTGLVRQPRAGAAAPQRHRDRNASTTSVTSSSSSAPIRRRLAGRLRRRCRPSGLRRHRRFAARAAWQTSVPGVFAVGDVRSGSVKRVGAPSAKARRSSPRCTPICPAPSSPPPEQSTA